MHETQADVDELYRLLERIHERSFDVMGLLSRQSTRIAQLESDVKGIRDRQDEHTVRLSDIQDMLKMHSRHFARIMDKLSE